MARLSGGLFGLLLRFLRGGIDIVLGLVDALFELLTRLRRGGLCRGLRIRNMLLELVELRGEFHSVFLPHLPCDAFCQVDV
jgi:hypothetical protein